MTVRVGEKYFLHGKIVEVVAVDDQKIHGGDGHAEDYFKNRVLYQFEGGADIHNCHIRIFEHLAKKDSREDLFPLGESVRFDDGELGGSGWVQGVSNVEGDLYYIIKFKTIRVTEPGELNYPYTCVLVHSAFVRSIEAC